MCNCKSYTLVCSIFRMASSHNSNSAAGGTGLRCFCCVLFISSFDNCPLMPHCMNCAVDKALNQEI